MSPCALGLVFIICYFLIGKQNQMKVKNFLNSNQKIILGGFFLVGIYLFYNNYFFQVKKCDNCDNCDNCDDCNCKENIDY